MNGSIDGLVERLTEIDHELAARNEEHRHFVATYLRTTLAVKAEIERGGFTDNAWTASWDVVFGRLYLDAYDSWSRGEDPPGPWRITFEASRDASMPPLRHVLLGMNGHINFDLPQALLAVIPDEGFDDPELLARRAADHRHIDEILEARVAEEDRELLKVEEPGDRSWLDRLLMPLNRAGTRRFLKEARTKVWRNAFELSRARRQGERALRARIDELGALAADRVADLRRPGQVVLRLSLKGFGVLLPPLAAGQREDRLQGPLPGC